MSKAKAKQPVKSTKEEAKELEAARLAEEQRRIEEMRQKEREEAKKREIIVLPTGLTLYINEYCIHEAWKHVKPKEFLIECISRVLRHKEIIDNFEPIEISIIAEFHLYGLIFAKEELELDDKKTTVMLNILWSLLMNKNPFYERKINLREYTNEVKESLNAQKTIENDLNLLQRHLLAHCVDNPPSQMRFFSPLEVKRILEYANDGYLTHFNLFKYILFNKQKDEEIKISVYVEKPLPIKPLSEALYMGKEKHEIKEDAEDELRKEAEEMRRKAEFEKMKQEEEERRLAAEEENRLDPKTMELIQKRLKEAENNLQKELDDREKELQARLDAMNPKKKK